MYTWPWRSAETLLTLYGGVILIVMTFDVSSVSISEHPEVPHHIRSPFNVTQSTSVGIYQDNTKKVPSAHVRKARSRRNVMQMARMLKCMSGCNPLSYRGYGCYCGYMGSGQPVDEIDRCCLQHDWCYAFISCPQALIYFVPYTWHCVNPGSAQCGVPSMPGVSQKCATQLCECDREFARCVSNYPCPQQKPSCKSNSYMMFHNMVNNDK